MRSVISIKIPVVDDGIILEEALETLTQEGYECFGASKVEAAVEIVNTIAGIVLIITDLKMPRKTGADLIKTVETRCGQQIKLIVMSGHASPGIEGNGIDIASCAFLKKPLDIEDLINLVAFVLATRE